MTRADPASAAGARRRRPREQSSAEIVAAAEALLRRRPLRDLSVADVMADTNLSRSSFYVYFRDRHELLVRIVQEIGDELFFMFERWFTGEGGAELDVRLAAEGATAVYAAHGPVMRAISDAASVDPAVETVYHALVARFIDATALRLREEIAAGRAQPVDDPQDTALALVWMAERYLSQSLGTVPPRVSPGQAAATLTEIWLRAAYGVV